MLTIGEALDELEAGLKLVSDERLRQRINTDPGANLTAVLPAVVIGLPDLTFGSFCRPPTGATFTVYVVGELNATVIKDLAALATAVVLAIEENTSATVNAVEGGVYLAGRTELPCYQIRVEYDL